MKPASLPLDLRALFNMQFVLLQTWCVWGCGCGVGGGCRPMGGGVEEGGLAARDSRLEEPHLSLAS